MIQIFGYEIKVQLLLVKKQEASSKGTQGRWANLQEGLTQRLGASSNRRLRQLRRQESVEPPIEGLWQPAPVFPAAAVPLQNS